jgi:predicted enzyme related to lactoylglutathione lyase
MSTRSTPWPHGTPTWVDLSTSDIATSTAFYSALMGWEVNDLGSEFGNYHIATRRGLSTAGMAPSMTPDQPNAWTTYLAADDVDKTADAITAYGGRIIAPPMDVAQQGRMAIAADPTGAVFGLWQARSMIGAQLVNEPGGIVWNDQTSSDPQAARRFYAAVFGYTYSTVDGGQDYATIDGAGPGGTIGGIGALAAELPPGTPARWTVYFAVEDVDVACTTATDNGGAVIAPPFDTPYGRMAGLQGPEGASFMVSSFPEATATQ